MKVTGQMRFVIISLGLFCLILGTEQRRPRSEQPVFETPALTGALYNFTCKLFATLTKSNGTDNIIVSPISIHKALSMVVLGANKHSETEREILHTLGGAHHEDYEKLRNKFNELRPSALDRLKPERGEKADSKSEGDDRRKAKKGTHDPVPPVLDLFNMIVTKGVTLRTAYDNKIKKHYNSSVASVDDKKSETKTKILDELNKWGKEAGFDQPILKREDLDDKFAAWLLSAIRVQAFWSGLFHESQNGSVFYNHGIKDKPVDGTKLIGLELRGVTYLNLTNRNSSNGDKKSDHNLGDLNQLNAQVVQVPLDGGMSFTIFEPLEHSTPSDNKLKKLVKRLFARKKAGLMKVLKMLADKGNEDGNEVALEMPKFEFEKEFDIKEILISMGIRKAFNEGEAELSQMTHNELFISKAKHQAMIEVNKVGIKAAGVTKIQNGIRYFGYPKHVTINKPFVFLIRYGEIPLFVGQLNKLEKAN